MGLISRVSSRTYSKTGELGEEHLVYSRQSAKARKHNTPSKSPTSPSCYFQPGKYYSSTNSPVRYNKTQSLRKHHSLSKIKLNYEERTNSNLESQATTKTSSLPVYYFSTTLPCQILLNQLPNTSTAISMSAAKVRVHNTSTSSIDAVVEPFYRKLEKIHVDSSKLQVTCNETFLEDVKVLKPIDGVIPPAAKDVLPYSPKQKIVVGVSGVSCGGKTTVASGLNNWLNKSEQNATLIMQDDFYKPASELPINSITNFPEFDEPESVRMDLIKDKILEWLDEPVELDQEDAQILIVEGTMIFTDPDICELCDLRYLVHVDFEVAKYRRSLRNYKIPDPPEIVARNIWPKYIKHREIFRQLKNKYSFMCKQINGTVPVEQTIAGILLDVKVNQHR